MIAWLIAHERWLPGFAAAVWWVTFYPGFFGDDSLSNLAYARSGAIQVGFTAWWIFVVDAVSLGTRAIPLLTLVSVVCLGYSTYVWMTAVFPPGRGRALAVAITFTPLVGAMAIQLGHDAPMTSGLLIAAAVLTRTWSSGRLAGAHVTLLVLAAPLIATRHNGLPTLLAAAVVVAMFRHWRHAAALVAVAAGVAAITFAATRAAGHTSSVHPTQTVEWMTGDISCLLSKPGVTPTAEEWATLAKIAEPTDWPQPRSCFVMWPAAVTRDGAAIERNYRALIGVWGSLTLRYPLEMATAHASRVRTFLPPFMTGVPESFVVSFLHSTILPNDFGLEWAWPALAERARIGVRAWNAAGFVLANSAVWLGVMLLVAWRRRELRQALTPTIVIGVALNLGLVAVAPVSEGRYGLFILICGQATALFVVLSHWPAPPGARGDGRRGRGA